MSAAYNNVEAYAASQVFNAVGINRVGYSLSVFTADTTSLHHRDLIQALCCSSYLITAWLGGPIPTAFLNGAVYSRYPLVSAFFLLPFNLYALQAKGWDSPMTIYFLVFGIVLLILFGIWERFFAKICFIPWKLLLDRTVARACILPFALFFSYMCWSMYFTSILQVVFNMSVMHISYIMSTFTVGGYIFAALIRSFIS
ncbi:hypothetical protein G6011_00790 [Alternaria panax]|uniref:Uncharacterized protein n=1 Tax=Alternaria panax TaxID=48097 RepID=A0AAD4NVD2_9PLEO|nr:hypothetical protein G6011_00790 [Alternaria panax]